MANCKSSAAKKRSKTSVRQAWRALSEDTGDFWVEPRLPVFNQHMAAPVDFAREIYSRYHPAILVGMTDHWPASENWTRDYLLSKLGDRKVSINLTPDGMADSIQTVLPHDALPEEGEEKATPKEYFVYPAEVEMTISEFYTLLDDRHTTSNSSPIIPYLSQQNDNLRQHLPELLEDIDLYVPLAREVFGCDYPEAVNLWIGDERSVSSMHKDHFENFYFVISGEKTFTLLPPSDTAFIPEFIYPTARYTAAINDHDGQRQWDLTLTKAGCPSDELSWTPLDPEVPESVAKFPKFAKYAHPIQVTVSAGECLYIPSMWYHRVSQNELTVSVNFWYDQRFDFRYVFFKAIQSMMSIADNNSEDDEESDEEEIVCRDKNEEAGIEVISTEEYVENSSLPEVESYSDDV